MSIAAYHKTRATVESPRATEHRLFVQITAELMAAREAGATGTALMAVLYRNRELWTVLSDDCATKGNGLPPELRASIISLALWVDRHTSAVMAGQESIDDLIDVNRMIIEGLS